MRLNLILTLCLAASLCVSPISQAAGHPGKILVVLSAAEQLTLKNGKKHETGFYLNELMTPVGRLLEAGFELEFATPDGKVPHLDPSSDDRKYFGGKMEAYQSSKRLLEKLKILQLGRSPVISLASARKKDAGYYQGLFVPGGHAPMVDLIANSDLGALLKNFHASKIPTAFICHGPVALLSARTESQGNWIYSGYKMTVFSLEEEKTAESTKLGGQVPFYPSEALSEAGGLVENGKAWKSHVVVDRELITGQNPNSDIELVEQLISKLNIK